MQLRGVMKNIHGRSIAQEGIWTTNFQIHKTLLDLGVFPLLHSVMMPYSKQLAFINTDV